MLKGMAMPLLFFPSSFLTSMSTLLIPEISEASALHQQERVERTINRTLHITLTASILISGIFTLFARDLGLLIYNSAEVGFLLQVLAPLMPGDVPGKCGGRHPQGPRPAGQLPEVQRGGFGGAGSSSSFCWCLSGEWRASSL